MNHSSTRKSKKKSLNTIHDEDSGGSPSEKGIALLCVLGDRLTSYLNKYKVHFRSQTHTCYPKVLTYCRGLFKCEKKKATCTGIVGAFESNGESQALNHMVSHGAWDYKAVMSQIANRCKGFFNLSEKPTRDICLIIDEVGLPKKGIKSACVGRQWLGCVGKQDNGQVAVALVICCKRLFSLINLQLFMPEAWAKDKKRRKEAKIPTSVTFQTKLQIALEIIKNAITQGIRFGWVGFDSLYGRSFELRKALGELGVIYVGDIPKDTHFYIEDPKPCIPQWSGIGSPPKRPITHAQTIQLDDYEKSLDQEDWDLITFRQGSRNNMVAWFHRKTIWIWPAREFGEVPQKGILIIRKEIDSGEIKYSFTNAPEETSTKRLAFMQGERFFVEQAFKEGKNQVGMGDYQLRSWDGFHRHMAICMLGLNFIMEEKARLFEIFPNITAEDIRGVIAKILPSIHKTIVDKIRSVIKKESEYGKQKERSRRKFHERIQYLIK